MSNEKLIIILYYYLLYYIIVIKLLYYNIMDVVLQLKVISVLVIFFGSILGTSMPWILNLCKSSWTHIVFLMCKLFSAGIILGTGLMHMLPDSQNSFDQLNLSNGYPYSTLIAGLSLITIMAIEQVINQYFNYISKKNEHTYSTNDDIENHGHQLEIISSQTQYRTFSSSDGDSYNSNNTDDHHHGKKHCHSINVLHEEELTLKRLITVYILEFGIAIHSIIIGVTLGTIEDKQTLSTLLVAMTFHQLFEGMGLGTTIFKAKIENNVKVILMMLIFATTTPFGIIIGILISNSYDSNSDKSFLVEGTFDAISSGILIYMALIHLIIEDYNNNEISGILKIFMTLSIFGGFGVMSIIALWT